MSKLPLSLQVVIFLACFVPIALYMVGGLETEDGNTLLLIVLIGGLISTVRAIYKRNKQAKRVLAKQEDE